MRSWKAWAAGAVALIFVVKNPGGAADFVNQLAGALSQFIGGVGGNG